MTKKEYRKPELQEIMVATELPLAASGDQGGFGRPGEDGGSEGGGGLSRRRGGGDFDDD